jgi:hypothetical protein
MLQPNDHFLCAQSHEASSACAYRTETTDVPSTLPLMHVRTPQTVTADSQGPTLLPNVRVDSYCVYLRLLPPAMASFCLGHSHMPKLVAILS